MRTKKTKKSADTGTQNTNFQRNSNYLLNLDVQPQTIGSVHINTLYGDLPSQESTHAMDLFQLITMGQTHDKHKLIYIRTWQSW